MASILEVGAHGERFFNVFDAAPENERTIAAANGTGTTGGSVGQGQALKVCHFLLFLQLRKQEPFYFSDSPGKSLYMMP